MGVNSVVMVDQSVVKYVVIFILWVVMLKYRVNMFDVKQCIFRIKFVVFRMFLKMGLFEYSLL